MILVSKTLMPKHRNPDFPTSSSSATWKKDLFSYFLGQRIKIGERVQKAVYQKLLWAKLIDDMVSFFLPETSTAGVHLMQLLRLHSLISYAIGALSTLKNTNFCHLKVTWDGRMDERTDTTTCRVAQSHLKINIRANFEIP